MPDEMRFVGAAYTVTWVVLLVWTGYTWRVWRRARSLFLETRADEEGGR